MGNHKENEKMSNQLDLFDLFEQAAKAALIPKSRFQKDDVYALHEGLLKESLSCLTTAKKSEERKSEVINWLIKPFKLTPAPFSFQACCVLTGLDPDKFKGHVIKHILEKRLLH